MGIVSFFSCILRLYRKVVFTRRGERREVSGLFAIFGIYYVIYLDFIGFYGAVLGLFFSILCGIIPLTRNIYVVLLGKINIGYPLVNNKVF